MSFAEALQEAEGRLAMIAAGLASRKTIRREDAMVLRKELARLREQSRDRASA